MLALILIGLLKTKHTTMRKMILLLSLVPGLLVGSSVMAQKFEGVASYKSSMNIESINVAGRNMSPEMQESVRKQLMQQSQRDFPLIFNLQELEKTC